MREVARPNSFIFTLYGDLVHGQAGDGSLWVGSLIALMACFGVTAPAVRQAVSRMSRAGWLKVRKQGGRAFYAVTARGRRRIEELSPRIYGTPAQWDGRWRLLTYSVAETNRAGRDRLRKDLGLLGWAPLSASTWISPRDALDEVREAARAAGVENDVVFFSAETRGSHDDRSLLYRSWNVETIAAAYSAFIRTYGRRFARERDHPHLSDEAAFVERLWLVHDYRKFTYIDPGLPSTLLPPNWAGASAAAIFHEYYRVLERKSVSFFLGVTGKAAAG
jgi:phenylacetic acid degradation operon negative regulatory protein